jgi:hypothetical protein
MKTGAIIAAGRVLIHSEEFHDKDLLPKEPPSLMGGGVSVGEVGYDVAVEQVLIAENSTDPFHVKIWTDKNQFRIGDPVTFYFSSDRDCYMILFDQGTSGVLRVIFPNPYQRDNFIQAGKTYAVPGPGAGYEIRVDGPPGIERIKALASLIKTQLPGEISDRFYELSPQNGDRVRDLVLSVKKMMDDRQWTQSFLEIDIVSPDHIEGGRPRKLKPKRPDKPVDIIGTPGAIERKGP